MLFTLWLLVLIDYYGVVVRAFVVLMVERV